MKKNACQMPISFLKMQKSFGKGHWSFIGLGSEKKGTLSVKIVHKENGTMWRKG